MSRIFPVFFLAFVLSLSFPAASTAGDLEDNVRGFLQAKESRVQRGRHEAFGFGTPDHPKYVILKSIKPDAVPVREDVPEGWLDRETAGGPVACWEAGPFSACSTDCGAGTRTRSWQCVNEDGTEGTCRDGRPEDVVEPCQEMSGCLDCKGVLAGGGTASGVYRMADGRDAYCDQDTAGGGWTRVTVTDARTLYGGTLTWITKASHGFDGSGRPWTQDGAGGQHYFYDFTLPFTFTQYRLASLTSRMYCPGSHSYDISTNGGLSSASWTATSGSSWGNVGMGPKSAPGPMELYAQQGVNGSFYNGNTVSAPGNGIVRSGFPETDGFRFVWREGGGESEGIYPWWSGYVYVR